MKKKQAEFEKIFKFPFSLHDYQQQSVEELIPRNCSLLKYIVGLGKTATATATALRLSIERGVEQIIILCPPILLDQWAEFLASIGGVPDVLIYRGSPKERALMDLDTAVVICSYNIFRGTKKLTADHKRFIKLSNTRKLCIIADELSLKDLGSQTYRKLKMMLYGKMRVKPEDVAAHHLIALNATPISDLEHTYNWCALMQPGIYNSKKLFEFAHVKKTDHWGKVTEWKNLELMTDNFNIVSVDTDEEVELPPLIETVVPYSLTAKHLKLYKRVSASMLEDLPDDKIELAVNSMFSTLQRLALAPAEFGLDVRSPVLDFIEGYIDQMAPEDKLVVFTRHVAVSKLLSESINGAVAVYGGVPEAVRVAGVQRVRDGKSRVIVANMDACGFGLNWQFINHVIYAELPFRDDKKIQTTGRVHRQGQKKTSFTNLLLAKGTIQEQIYYKLLKNEEELRPVLKTKKDVVSFLED